MRITNKIMQNNNLSNINTNKIYKDKLSTQMSSQKKINRPSDDPVIAIRALRLRSNVTEITQYYSKNIPDAESWLSVTESAIKNLSQIITNMIGQCETGSNSPLTTANRQIILEQLKALGEEVYSTGDADYAGRYVFTGYRTNTPLSFMETQKVDYTLTEQLDSSAIDSIVKVNTGNLLDLNSGNYNDADMSKITDQDISSVEVYRIRLAYNDCSDYGDDPALKTYVTNLNDLLGKIDKYADPVNAELGTLTPPKSLSDYDFNNLSQTDLTEINTAITNAITNADPNDYPDIAADLNSWTTDWSTNEAAYPTQVKTPEIKFTDPTANPAGHLDKTWPDTTAGAADPARIITMHSYEDPYAFVAKSPSAIVYVPETGEILLGKDRYETLVSTKDLEGTPNLDESEIQITYDKGSWQKGDLRPEHYFACEATVDGEKVEYNKEYLEPNAERQTIEYDVGFNQTIRVNSTADECFKHGVGREVDDLLSAIQNVLDLEGVQANLKELEEKIPSDDPNREQNLQILKKQQEAVEKALTLAKDKEQKLFESSITAFQKHLDDANLCITNCGSRSSKLELIKNRMQNQKTTFETLKSENEDIDITEVAIQLSSAELTYDAALMAAGKVMKTTLLNFI